MGARALLAGAVIAAIAVAAPRAHATPVSGGTITVGRGADGVRLGMTRATVIQRVGRPLAENANGVMSYGRDPVIFDIYRKLTNTVQQFVIAGGNFTLQDGNHIFAKGGLKRLSNRYGKRLKFHKFEDGSPYYELISTLHHKRVLTDFPTDVKSLSGRVLDVFILFG